MKLLSSVIAGSAVANTVPQEKTRFVEGGCASYIYGSDWQKLACANACPSATKVGRGGSIGFKMQMETDRSMVAFAKVSTETAGDWPSVNGGDSYIGLVRFDESKCGAEMLMDMEQEGSLYLDFGDKGPECYVFEAMTYSDASSAKKNALMAQFRKLYDPEFCNGELWVKKQDEDKFVMSLTVAAWTSFAMSDIKTCFESAYLSVMEDDLLDPHTVDYTKCALYERYGKQPDWLEFGTGNSTDPWSTSGTWTIETTPETTTSSGTDGTPPDNSDFAELTDQIPFGVQCTSSFPGSSAKNHKIVGGTITDEGTYPWQVRLSLDGMYQCGGSIIHDNWVMTAAHCCEGITEFDIMVGDWDQWSNGDRGEFSVKADAAFMHPNYPGPNGIANDVCLLKVPSLEQAAPSSCQDDSGNNTCFASVCLPANNFEHGEACWVSGWGTTTEGGGGSVSQTMKSVGVNLFSHAYCNSHVNEEFKGATLDGLEICGGTPDLNGDGLTDSGSDSCQGDSGGPLTCLRDGQPVLAGVVSWGYGCANTGLPGVYANTFAYMNWIETTTADAGIPITGGPATTGATTGADTTTTPTTQSGTDPSTGEWDPVPDTIQPELRCTTTQKSEKKGPSKIVGGEVTDEHDYPWQVRLSIGGGLCGGTILSDRWVLTAAHCCQGASSASISIGDWRMNAADTGEFAVDAKEIIIHPNYPGANDIANDVCLLRTPSLANKVTDGTVYAAACLPTEDYRHGEACHVSGWGTTSSGGSTSNKMREVGMNLMSIPFCNDPANVKNSMVGATIEDKEICAGTPDSASDDNTLVDAGKDACQGDSGGPLTCVRNGQPVVAGVVSWGFGCAAEGQPGVYANVWHYKQWILETAAEKGFPLQ